MNNRQLAGLLLIGMGAVVTVASAASRELLLSGRLEAVDVTRGQLVVLGQSVPTPQARQFVVGQFVRVYGTLLSSGQIADAMVESVPTHDAAETMVFMKGVVSRTDSNGNSFYVGSTSISVSPNASGPTVGEVQVGSIVELIGQETGGASSLLSHIAIMSQGGERGAIMSQGGERGAIMSQGGERGAIMSQGGERGE